MVQLITRHISFFLSYVNFSRGKKRAAPTSPDVHEVVVEAPTKRARRGAVKKTLEKTQVTASALQRRFVVQS